MKSPEASTKRPMYWKRWLDDAEQTLRIAEEVLRRNEISELERMYYRVQ